MMDSLEWYWRMRLGFPPRSEDHETIRRIAPELFCRGRENIAEPAGDQHTRFKNSFREEIKSWLGTLDDRPRVTVHEGACPQNDCPLGLGGRTRQVSIDRTGVESITPEGTAVIELMTVAGGWSAKAKTFFDMARKVHGGKGEVTHLLLTDPYIYLDKSEEDTTGGLDNFRKYLDCLDISRKGLAIYQPPYAKGKRGASGALWRRTIEQHGRTHGYSVRFGFFRTLTNTRFHDRFYLTRHRDGSVSGLFGPSLNGLNDRSFVLVGELEDLTLKRLLSCLDGWA